MVKEDRDGVVVDAYEIIALYGDKVRTKCTKFGAAASYCDVRFGEKNVEYRYDYETGQCTHGPNEYPFRPIGVPIDAKALGDGYIGASGDPGAGLLVSSFFGIPRLGKKLC